MRYRRFGRTELSMPVISCGGMRYQYKWQDVDPREVPPDNQTNLEATIHRAIELGINHIETARGYGSSEMQLGHVLPTLPRDKIIVQTKVAPKETAKEFLSTFETSMKYLRLDYVDLLSLHGINNRQLLEFALRKDGCVAAARKLQREGRARHIGFSTHATPDIIMEAVEQGDFDYMNVHWCFVNDLNWSATRRHLWRRLRRKSDGSRTTGRKRWARRYRAWRGSRRSSWRVSWRIRRRIREDYWRRGNSRRTGGLRWWRACRRWRFRRIIWDTTRRITCIACQGVN